MKTLKTCQYWDKNGNPKVEQIKSLLASKGDASEKLRALMDDAGITVRGMAEKLDISEVSVSRWFSYSKPKTPSLERLVYISNIFHLNCELENELIRVFYPLAAKIQDDINSRKY